MSFKPSEKFYQSANQPSSPGMGDSWLNTSTNRLYKYVGLSGNAPSWIEIPTATTANTVAVNNVSVAGRGTFIGTPSTLALSTPNIVESLTIVPAAPLNQINYYVTAQTIIYYTVAATTNMVVNITGNDLNSLNSLLSIGQSVSLALLITNGASGFYVNAVRVDGVAQTVKWQAGSVPSAGNTNSTDMYTFAVMKTANATFSIFGAQIKYA
jgi:uncharacterized membrane protein